MFKKVLFVPIVNIQDEILMDTYKIIYEIW